MRPSLMLSNSRSWGRLWRPHAGRRRAINVYWTRRREFTADDVAFANIATRQLPSSSD
jgi:hypothetical protein